MHFETDIILPLRKDTVLRMFILWHAIIRLRSRTEQNLVLCF